MDYRIGLALEVAKHGQFDGAHHKDWVIQEMVRVLYGWSEDQLVTWLGKLEWPRGIVP